MGYHINGVEEMAAAALASGTHRIRITQEGVNFCAELVEREEPDRQVLYMQKPKQKANTFVCPTPIPDNFGGTMEIIGVFDGKSPVGVNLFISSKDSSGKTYQVRLTPEF